MVGNSLSSSSSSSSASFDLFDDVTVSPSSIIVKFLCSYGGKISPRYPDGKLRYVGGETRVLAVDRSIPFSDLQTKMTNMCGLGSMSLRCQLPSEDLDDALVSITSDEDLANLYEEYDLAGRDRLKIRAFLFPQQTPKSHTPPPPPHHPSSARESTVRSRIPVVPNRCVHPQFHGHGQYRPAVHHRNH